MPPRKPAPKSWLDLACDAVVGFGYRMRDELKAGKDEVLQSKGDFDYEAESEAKPKALAANVTNWWEVLKVEATATHEEIKRAYRQLIKENHPDKVTHLSPEEQAGAERQAKLLNDAYDLAMRPR